MDGCVHQSLQKPEVQLPILKKRMLGVISADPDPIVIKADILFVVVTILVVLLRYLSSRRSHIIRHKLGRYFLSGASAAYFSLISYIFSYLTTYLSSDLDDPFVLMLAVLLQFLKSNSDMAALAVAAVASPTAGDHVDSQKIRPSMESLVSSLWVAGLVIYYMLLAYTKKKSYRPHDYLKLLAYADLSIFLLWVLGVARLVLRFVAFEHVNGSFSIGRNAQLTEGYMAQLQEQEDHLGPVPRLIVTGEKKLDVEESPQGYRVKEDKSSRLVTLDKVWSSPCLSPEAKDLCLSFSLFKCLRRRFAGYRLAEAGSNWAFRFVCDGLLGHDDDHMRIFKVISCELSFASDFYYSPLPVASLGARSATLHFFLSVLIFTLIFLMFLLVLLVLLRSWTHNRIEDTIMLVLLLFVTLFILSVEMAEMVTSVHSNWTKISMVGHYINRSCWSRIISPCLLRSRITVCCKDEIGQNLLLNPSRLPSANVRKIFLPRNNIYKPVVIKVSPDVKDSIMRSLKKSRGKLSNGVATVQCRYPDLTWTCYDRVTTSTDTILVWYIATSLIEIKVSSAASALAHTTTMAVATSLSRYCTYLVAHAPDLLPDNAAWTRHRYQKVKKCIEAVCNRSAAASSSGLYSHPIESFGDYESNDNDNEMVEMETSRLENELTEEEVVKIGSTLGKQLMEEARRQRDPEEQSQEQCTGEEVVWKILAEFWSEMILYLAPSDNVKGHIEALRRGGELITLLWALLLHAGITSRPARVVPNP